MFIHTLKHHTITELRARLVKELDNPFDAFQADEITKLIKERTCKHQWRFNGGTATESNGRVGEDQLCVVCDKRRRVFASTGRVIVR